MLTDKKIVEIASNKVATEIKKIKKDLEQSKYQLSESIVEISNNIKHINGTVIDVDFLTAGGKIVPVYFIAGNTYVITNNTTATCGKVWVAKDDNVQIDVTNGIDTGKSFTFIADDAYTKIRFYANGTGTISVEDKGLKNQFENFVNKNTLLTVVFSSSDKPIFDAELHGNTSTLHVKFPSVYMNAYRKDQSSVDKLAFQHLCIGEKFTITTGTAIAYNSKTDEIVKVDALKDFSEGMYPLLVLSNERVSGLLEPYYNAYIYNSLRTKLETQDKLRTKNATFNSVPSFVVFSDIHADATGFQRIINYANENKLLLKAVINCGDTVRSLNSDGIAWYDAIVDSSEIDVLNCIGNHDAWSTGGFAWDSETHIYEMFTAKVANKVANIVQPLNASANGYNYYYKDYGGGIRVIVLNAMSTDGNSYYWDSVQANWLEDVLSDALTKSKSVICVNHAPFRPRNITKVSDHWNSVIDYVSTSDFIYTNVEAVQKVKAFKDNGGKFVCWLSGHTHLDSLRTNDAYPNQLMLNISTANRTMHTDGYADETIDCFNVISIDATNNLLKVRRVGYTMDFGMIERNHLCYNYATNTVIAEG